MIIFGLEGLALLRGGAFDTTGHEHWMCVLELSRPGLVGCFLGLEFVYRDVVVRDLWRKTRKSARGALEDVESEEAETA